MRNSKKTKKHPIASVFCKLGIVLVALFAFSAAGVGVYGICEKENYDGCYNYKLDLLKKAHDEKAKKAVFVGGSATNFGVRADYFEAKTGIRAINMGFSAGRSFDAYLKAIQPYMDEGDELFLLPESGYWAGPFHKVDNQTMLFQQHNAPHSVTINSPVDLWNYVTGWIGNGWEGWANSFKFLSKKISIDKLHLGSWTIYDRWECNKNGDFTLSQIGAEKDFAVSAVSYSKDMGFAKDLGAYLQRKMRGVHAHLVANPNVTGAIKDVAEAERVFELYSSVSGVPCLLKPGQALFDKEFFLDSQLHLKSASAELFTDRIVNAFLKK